MHLWVTVLIMVLFMTFLLMSHFCCLWRINASINIDQDLYNIVEYSALSHAEIWGEAPNFYVSK